MKPRYVSRLAVLTAAGVVAAVLAPASAGANPSGDLPGPAVAALAASLGDRSAGYYYDTDRRATIVTVTNRADAEAARRVGATPRLVERSGADLARVTDALNREARIPGTAWAVDVPTNRVVVSYDDTVTGAKLTHLTSVTGRYGDAVRLESMPGTLRPNVSGGQPVYTDNGTRCTLGFNLLNSAGTTFYFITAGHCTGTYWYADSARTILLGVDAGGSFPGDDFRIVRYTNTSIAKPGNVYLYNGSYQDILTAGNAYVGQTVRRSGSTTGVRSGSVTALNATVTYPQGTVYGLVRTNVCAEAGDSGGPFFSGTTALGITSGGSGNCTSGGTTYFQPVTEALSRYGLQVY